MMHRRYVVPALIASLWVGACKKDPPPPPEPAPAENAVDTAAERMRREAEQRRRDSIAAAEREAREAAERRRAAIATLEEMVFFDYDQSDIRPDAERVLRNKVDILRASPQVRIRIEGHADERGSTEYNLALGQRRAESVRAFFVNFGLDSGRFTVVSRGEQDPLVNRSDEAAWARNRRAEFTITAGESTISMGR